MCRVAVTGASGFVGRHVVQRLLAGGHEVTALVRSEQAATDLPAAARVVVLGDLVAWPWLETVHTLRNHSAIIHLAAAVHRPERLGSDRYFFRVNVEGTCRVALAAAAARVPHLVFISSVHAVTTAHPLIVNEATPCRPTTGYGKSKLEAERALAKTLSPTQTRWTVVRPPPVYGPGQVGHLRMLFDAVLRGRLLPIGAVRARRSFVFVENLADALCTVACHPDAGGRTYFVSDGPAVTLPELVQTLAALAGRRPRILSVPESCLWAAGLCTGRLASIRRLLASLVVDDSPLREELGWNPPYSMQEGLARTLGIVGKQPQERRAA
ncbi:MAG: epimerase/dehydratase [Pirellulaceae bacterium]|nr:MAG: epimerase/dehydratase [Pirellulaceae bacterium]